MTPLLRALFAFIAVSAAPLAVAADAFQIGVLPNVSARIIATNYQPMREYFERELGRPVEVSTAGDFVTFHGRTVAGDYDLAVTAANFGRLAQVDQGRKIVAIYEPAIPGLLVMHKDRPVKAVGELRGKALALANPQSLVALRGLDWLREQGLAAGTDFRTVHARNDDSLAQLLSQEAPLAMMSMGEFRAIREDLRNALAIHSEFARVPGFLLVAGPAATDADVQRLRGVLERFMAADEGKRFAAAAGVQKIRLPADAELRSLDPYLDATRAAARPR